MDEALLSIRDLKVQYLTRVGAIKAIEGVSFDIKKGETLGLIGESGCGKTTTALAILRLLKNAKIEGEVLFNGENLLRKPKGELRRIRGKEISMIFQESTGLNPVLRIGDQLREVIEVHHSSMDAEELLSIVGLSEPEMLLKCYPHELSSGMRQRVMIAMAIASRPKLVIADEPTSMLDATIQIHILNLLEQLKKELKLSMLFISHDIGAVGSICDSIAVMYAGRVVELCKVEAAPAHPYTLALLEIFSKQEKQIEGDPVDPASPPDGCPFHPRCKYAEEVCKTEVPEIEDVKEGHYLRCHLRGAL